MNVYQVLLVAVLLAMENTLGQSKCNSNRPVSRIYPLRRRITFPAATTGTTGCYLTHSGLLLEMTDGKACVLEYSTDGNARLYDVNPVYYNFPCWWKKCYIISPTYSGTGNYQWSRDTSGYDVEHQSISPKAARDTMQGIMGNHYHLTKRNSHQAISALAEKFGLPAEDIGTKLGPLPSKRSVCSCVSRPMSNLVPADVHSALQMAQRACKK